MGSTDSNGLHVITCFTCTIKFGLSEDFYKNRKKNLKRFYCPVGHGQVFRAQRKIGTNAKFWRNKNIAKLKAQQNAS